MERSIDATTTVHAAPARARALLLEDPGAILADPPASFDPRTRDFRSVLTVQVGSGTAVQQAVDGHLDPPRPDAAPDSAVVPVHWHAAGHEKLFPTFDGELSSAPARTGTTLRLTGTYTVPLGAFGRFGDGVAGRRVAKKALTALLEEIAQRLDTEVVRRIDGTSYTFTSYPVAIHDRL